MKAYKIFDLGYDEDGRPRPKTLFHGVPVVIFLGADSRVGRSRLLPCDTWLTAEAKLVRDGSGNAQYMSGFHCYTNLDSVKAWFKRGSPVNRVVAMVEIEDNARHKNRAIRHTLLATHMKIHREDWETRFDAESLMREPR